MYGLIQAAEDKMSIIPTSLIANNFTKLLGNIEYGVIHLIAPDNRIITAGGTYPGPEVTWKLYDWRVLFRYIACGERALGEDYMAGRWEADNLKNLREFFRMNYNRLKRLSNCIILHYLLLFFSKIMFCRKPEKTEMPESEFRDILLSEMNPVPREPRPRDHHKPLRHAFKSGESAAILDISEFRKSAH